MRDLAHALSPSGIPHPPNGYLARPPRRRDGRPAGPRPRLRDLGHLRAILGEGMLDAYLDWALARQDDYVVWAGPVPHVVVARPESARALLRSGGRFVRNAAPTRNLFGGGLLRLAGPPARARRSMFAPSLRRGGLDDAVAIVQRETDQLCARWASRRDEFKPARDLSYLLLRILGRVLFGFEFERERHGGRPLHRALSTLSAESVLRHFLPGPAVSLATGAASRRARRHLDTICEELLERGGATPFMDALRRALAEGQLSREVAIEELRTFLIAGHETSATALAWVIATLASYPARAAELRAEAERAVGARTVAEVASLAATDRWIKEVMRLYPPVPLSVWQAAEDTTLGRLEVPRGTRVDLCSYVLHRLPQVWPAPRRFDPDRFRASPPPGAYLPFLHGAHTCLGIHLAKLELPLIAARVAGMFDVELTRGAPRVNLRVSLHPAGFYARVRPRASVTRVARRP